MRDSVTARRGAAFLDERLPGWADLIDLDTLDLESSCHCVVGQIEAGLHPRARFPGYERFDRGLTELGIPREQASRLGFFGMTDGIVGRTWRHLIRDRQTAKAA